MSNPKPQIRTLAAVSIMFDEVKNHGALGDRRVEGLWGFRAYAEGNKSTLIMAFMVDIVSENCYMFLPELQYSKALNFRIQRRTRHWGKLRPGG